MCRARAVYLAHIYDTRHAADLPLRLQLSSKTTRIKKYLLEGENEPSDLVTTGHVLIYMTRNALSFRGHSLYVMYIR